MHAISFDKHDYTAPVPLTGFGSPLIGACYGFASSIASDDRCIEGRVEQYQRKGEEEEPIPPTLAGYMLEFAEFLVPVANAGHPVDDDEVRERQDRPSQRHIISEASVTGEWYKRAWACFVKKETYGKPTDPRNISTSSPATKLKYSRYQYAFGNDIMHDISWYAFNKNPRDIADRVVEILSGAKWAALADGNRFDAHVSRRARILERIILLRYFARQYHSALNEAMDEQIGMPGTTEHGRRYNSGYGRGSGSIETSNLNSVLSAFIGYCAHRNTLVDGRKKTPDEAWAGLGMYGGDDSIEGDVDPDALKTSSQLMGQDYEISVIQRGLLGVNFLNRYYGPDVWTGDVNSMANPKRLLAKLWVGPATLVDPVVRLGERLAGYYRMDKNSPVIGQISRVSMQLLGDAEDGELMPWDGKCSADTNWPNEDSGWMHQVFTEFIPDFDHDRFQQWITWVSDNGDPTELLRAPLCTDPSEIIAPKLACVIDDQLYQPEPTEPSTPPPEEEEGEPTTPRTPEVSNEDKLAEVETIRAQLTEALTGLSWVEDEEKRVEILTTLRNLPWMERAKPVAPQPKDVLRRASAAVPVPKPLAAKSKKPAPTRGKGQPPKSVNAKHPANWVACERHPGQTDASYKAYLKKFETRRRAALASGPRKK